MFEYTVDEQNKIKQGCVALKTFYPCMGTVINFPRANGIKHKTFTVPTEQLIRQYSIIGFILSHLTGWTAVKRPHQNGGQMKHTIRTSTHASKNFETETQINYYSHSHYTWKGVFSGEVATLEWLVNHNNGHLAR